MKLYITLKDYFAQSFELEYEDITKGIEFNCKIFNSFLSLTLKLYKFK